MGTLLHCIRDRQPLPKVDQAKAAAHYTALRDEALALVAARAAAKAKNTLEPPAEHVLAASYNGATFRVAAEPDDDGPVLYAVQLGGIWMWSCDVLSSSCIDGLQADIDKPDSDCSGPADFDAVHAAHVAADSYHRQLDAQAHQ